MGAQASWAPTTGWLLCDLHFNDGRPVPFATRHLFVGRNYEPIQYPLGDMAAGTLAVIFYRHRRGPTFARSENDPARAGFRLARATPDES